MRTEEERFEEWWEKEYPGMAEGFGARDAWIARAALDRPKLGLKIKYGMVPTVWAGNPVQIGTYYVCNDQFAWSPIANYVAEKLAGRELKPGEEVEV